MTLSVIFYSRIGLQAVFMDGEYWPDGSIPTENPILVFANLSYLDNFDYNKNHPYGDESYNGDTSYWITYNPNKFVTPYFNGDHTHDGYYTNCTLPFQKLSCVSGWRHNYVAVDNTNNLEDGYFVFTTNN